MLKYLNTWYPVGGNVCRGEAAGTAMIGKVHHHPGGFCDFKAPCHPSAPCFVTGSEM